MLFRSIKAKKPKMQTEINFDAPVVNNIASSRTAETVEFEEVRANPALFEEIFPMVQGWGISREVLQLLIETQPEDAVRNG